MSQKMSSLTDAHYEARVHEALNDRRFHFFPEFKNADRRKLRNLPEHSSSPGFNP